MATTWSKLRQLSIYDYFALGLLWFYLQFIVVLLRCVGLKTTNQTCCALAGCVRSLHRPQDHEMQGEIAFARHHARLVSIAAARGLLTIVCLPKSIALKSLLAVWGVESDLCVGVASDGPNGFHAHAWVEVGKIAVNDTDDVVFRFSSISRM